MTAPLRVVASRDAADVPGAGAAFLAGVVGGYLVVMFMLCILVGAFVALLCVPVFSLTRWLRVASPSGAFGRPPFSR